MNIEDRVRIALDIHHQGYNCVQAVIMAYNDVMNLSREDALKVSYGLGGGVGMMREVCGSVLGASMVISYKFSKEEADPRLKKEIYDIVSKFGKEFEERHGSIVCGELLGLRKTDKDVWRESCDQLIESSVRLLEKYVVE